MAIHIIRKKGNVSLKKVIALYDELSRKEVTIGVHKEEGQQINSETGTKLIDYAVYNEFGTEPRILDKDLHFVRHGKTMHFNAGTDIGIPSRPFVRIKDDHNFRLQVKNASDKVLQECVYNKFKSSKTYVSNRLYREVGMVYLKRMVGRIQNSSQYYKPNTATTIYLKEHDHILFDTGLLFKSLKYKIRIKGVN